MRVVCLTLVFTISLVGYTQVGIGTTEPSAQLHIETESNATSERTGLQLNLNVLDVLGSKSNF